MTTPAEPLTVHHTSAAPAVRVFDAWLDPTVASRWLFATPDGTIVRCEIDARPGGAFVITDRRPAGDVAHVGRYVEIDRPRRLVFTFGVPTYSDLETTVTLTLTAAGSGCEVTLRHEGVPPEWASQTEQGWRDLCARLEALLGA